MAAGIKTKLNKWWFDIATRSIYKTKTVRCDPQSGLVILSQLHSPDVTMYMLAAKSFARFIVPYRFIVVDDGLSPKDRAVLANHFENISFIPVNSVNTGSCPRGGTWERLISIAELNATQYVIQLDADTLTLSRPDEVINAVMLNRSFTLGTWGGRETTNLVSASEYANQYPGEHVQIKAESVFELFDDASDTRYVRGCSGFSGFSKNSLNVEKIETFSNLVASYIGDDKWREWGSEQVTSNFMIANSDNPLILPVERYPFWVPDLAINNVGLIHFVGSYRFSGGKYIDLARVVISQLPSA